MEEATGPVPVVKVLIALYPGMEAMNVLGPLEVLDKAYQNPGDTGEFHHLLYLTSLAV